MGVLAETDDFGYKSPHIARRNNNAGRLHELSHVDKPHLFFQAVHHGDDIKHGKTHNGHQKEYVEHAFFAYLAFNPRNQRHEYECGDGA